MTVQGLVLGMDRVPDQAPDLLDHHAEPGEVRGDGDGEGHDVRLLPIDHHDQALDGHRRPQVGGVPSPQLEQVAEYIWRSWRPYPPPEL